VKSPRIFRSRGHVKNVAVPVSVVMWTVISIMTDPCENTTVDSIKYYCIVVNTVSSENNIISCSRGHDHLSSVLMLVRMCKSVASCRGEGNPPRLLACGKIIGKFSSCRKIFVHKCKIWAEPPAILGKFRVKIYIMSTHNFCCRKIAT